MALEAFGTGRAQSNPVPGPRRISVTCSSGSLIRLFCFCASSCIAQERAVDLRHPRLMEPTGIAGAQMGRVVEIELPDPDRQASNSRSTASLKRQPSLLRFCRRQIAGGPLSFWPVLLSRRPTSLKSGNRVRPAPICRRSQATTNSLESPRILQETKQADTKARKRV